MDIIEELKTSKDILSIKNSGSFMFLIKGIKMIVNSDEEVQLLIENKQYRENFFNLLSYLYMVNYMKKSSKKKIKSMFDRSVLEKLIMIDESYKDNSLFN